MNYSELTFKELRNEVSEIQKMNSSMLNANAQYFEDLAETLQETEIEYLLRDFDDYRHFFRRVEEFFIEISHSLDYKDEKLNESPLITLGLIERLTTFGENAHSHFIRLTSNIDKGDLNKIPDVSYLLNSWYGTIGDNLHSISHLEFIADALNKNFRHVEPLDNVSQDNIAIQSKDGITITKSEDIYINSTLVRLAGQKKRIFILLAESHIKTPGVPVSWIEIENEIKIEGEMSKDTVVKRVSDLRTELVSQGFNTDIIEIRNTTYSHDSSWYLIKK
jgi:hypothetical protein